MSTLKVCSSCGLAKPREAFSKHKLHSDGLYSHCKQCKKATTAAYYAANKAKIRAKNDAYAKAKPEWKKSTDHAYHIANKEKHNAQSKSYYEEHKCRLRELNRENYFANREARLAWQKEYRTRRGEFGREAERMWSARSNAFRYAIKYHDGRARLTKSQIESRIEAYGWLCAYCGSPWECVDHLKPLKRGGDHMLANIRPACRSCNSRKFVTPPKVWLASLQKGAVIPLP